MGAWKNAFFLQENLHAHNIPRFGGGGGFWGGGGKCRFHFYGREDFSEIAQRLPRIAIAPFPPKKWPYRTLWPCNKGGYRKSSCPQKGIALHPMYRSYTVVAEMITELIRFEPEICWKLPLGTKTLPNLFGTDLGKVIFVKYFSISSPGSSLLYT